MCREYSDWRVEMVVVEVACLTSLISSRLERASTTTSIKNGGRAFYTKYNGQALLIKFRVLFFLACPRVSLVPRPNFFVGPA